MKTSRPHTVLFRIACLWIWMAGVTGLYSWAQGIRQDDLIAQFLIQPATNFTPGFDLSGWKFDDRDNPARQAQTAPSFFRIYHLHENHHSMHLNSDRNLGTNFLFFHQAYINAYNSWRLERGYDRLTSYVSCNPMSEGHVEFNNGLIRAPNSPMRPECQPMPVSFRVPPAGTLGSIAASPALPTLNAVGESVNLTWHSTTHFALGYADFLPDGRNGDMGSTDKSPLDPAFWMWHSAITDISDSWLRTQPVDLVLALDRSGSMNHSITQTDATSRLNAAKEGLDFLVHLLPQTIPGAPNSHRVGLVSFASDVVTNLPLTSITDPDFFANFTAALANISANGETSIEAGREAARNLVRSGTNTNPLILTLTDGAQNTDPGLCICGPACSCGDACSCHDDEMDMADMGHSFQNLPEHYLGLGTAWWLTPSVLARTAAHHSGFYLSTEGGAFEVKQQLALQFANTFEGALGMTGKGSLTAGVNTSSDGHYASYGDVAVTFVAIWDKAVTQGALGLEIVSPAGTVLNLNNPAISSVKGTTWHIVRIGVPPSGGNDGLWTFRLRRALGGVGQNENYFVAALGNGLGRVEPAPPSPYAYTGELLRPTFRIRDSYWPTNGFDTVTGSVEIVASGLDAGEIDASATPVLESTIAGDSISSRQATLDSLAASGTGPSSRVITNALTLRDDGSGGDAVANDHYYATSLMPPAEGEYQIHARFTFVKEGHTFTREARYAVRVETGISSLSTVDMITLLGMPSNGISQWAYEFTPRDSFNQRLGPGRATDMAVSFDGDGVRQGAVTDLGQGRYRATVASSASNAPGLLLKQAGRPAVLLGTTLGNAIVAGPESYSMRPDRVVITWKTSMPSDSRVEFSLGDSLPFSHLAIDTNLTTEHRVEVVGFHSLDTDSYRVRSRSPAGIEALSQPALYQTAPNSVARIVTDRLGYNGSTTNLLAGKAYLYEPAAAEVTVALSTAQTFTRDNPFTNAVFSVVIHPGDTEIPWSIPTAPVGSEVEVHVSVIYGDYPSHAIFKLLPGSLQLLSTTNLVTSLTADPNAVFDPYSRLIRVPLVSNPAQFFQLQDESQPVLHVGGVTNGQMVLTY
ncbi:MAG TPA: vWA domain-containing protein [Candidatus Limnocylindria bacterium]|nr:vWA domain-containing protein [Candidatus Limnocylindria bacterium]